MAWCRRGWVAAVVVGVLSCAAPARADDAPGLADEVGALKRRLAEQERRLRELENQAPTQDEIEASVARYLETTPTVWVGGADGGKAGWPMGGAPFVSEGANRINFHVRLQPRWSWFAYSDDAVGTLSSPPNTLSDAAPRDRSGLELERVYFGVDGSVFCPEITYQVTLNLDSDNGSGLEKEFMWLDWKYAGDHHVRAGVDKVPFTIEEQVSSASLAMVDRSLYTKAFALDSDTGVMLWGTFGPTSAPKSFLYKAMASNGEGNVGQAGSPFNTDGFGTYANTFLYSAMLEWTFTGEDWRPDEVDHRPCDKRCRLDASVGLGGYWEDDDDASCKSPGMALRSTGPLERTGLCGWFRARWQGFSALGEVGMRRVDYDGPAATQTDWGASVTLHYRFPESRWGVAARASWIWLDDDYDSLTVGNSVVPIDDRIAEYGVGVNYFIWDHSHKISADVNWVQDNSAVRSSSAGYLWDPSKGVVVEDGVMFRIQWQVNF